MPAHDEPARTTGVLNELVDSSVTLIESFQDSSGAYPASPTFSAYRGYCWLRDGSFIADGMSAAGVPDSADRFFSWGARAVNRYRVPIEAAEAAKAAGIAADPASLPPTRFTLAGEVGTDGWWDFQTDGYGTWLWALSEHVRRGAELRDEWRSAIVLTVRFLVATWDLPCYDWWEESQDQRHVSTLGCVAVGLERAVEEGWLESTLADAATAAAQSIRALVAAEGTHEGRLAKWLGSTDLDASLLALVTMGFLDDEPEIALATVEAVRDTLVASGGVHRYLGDVFYGGGLWPLLTCFLGLAELRVGLPERAHERRAFAESTATAAGDMPEQVTDHLLAPEHRQEWLDRWGPVATPLLWSHAMYIRLAVEETSK